MTRLSEIEAIEDLNKRHSLMQQWGQDRGFNHSYPGLIVMRYIATYWLIAPAWYGEHFHYSWINLATLVGIGGIWMFAFIHQLKGQTIIPIHETWVEEAVREGALRHGHA